MKESCYLVSGTDLHLPVRLTHPGEHKAALIIKVVLDAQVVAVPKRRNMWTDGPLHSQGFITMWFRKPLLKQTNKSIMLTWQSSPTYPHQCHSFCWPQFHRERTCPLCGLCKATKSENRDMRFWYIRQVFLRIKKNFNSGFQRQVITQCRELMWHL